MGFNTKATRWLEIYLDMRPQFRAYKNLILKKIRRAEDRVWHLAVSRCLS